MKKIYAVSLGLILAVSACGGDEPSGANNGDNNGSNNNGSNNGSNNNGSGSNNNGSNNNGMCTPLTECPVDTCGMVDDTCEGQIDCGECTCNDGTPVEVTCGPCGLGRQTCDPDETGDGTCLMPEGLNELGQGLDCAAELIYVDGAVTGPGVGTSSDPFSELDSAFAVAVKGSVIVVAAQDLTAKIEIKEGVHLLGGYDAGGAEWLYDEAGRSAVLVPSAEAGEHTIGLSAVDIIDTTYVSGLRVTTGAAAPGMNNYAAYLVRSNGVSLSRSEFEAGAAGVGVDGSAGVVGGPGAVGEPGVNHSGSVGNLAERHVCVTVGGLATETGNLIGEAGIASGCPATKGGKGGEGASERDGVLNQLPLSGEDSSGGALGGTAPSSEAVPRGQDGVDGLDGADGADGSGGVAMSAVVDEHLVNSAGAGGNGAMGSDGVGGGGGGGSFGPRITTVHTSGNIDWKIGLSGAGGGSGGCAGTEGTGGGPGGASLGLFLYQGAPKLTNLSFAGGTGGRGGNGADGGVGGGGANGGASATTFCAPAYNAYTSAFRSGAGGDGGQGGDGGKGGGGAGGASYGAYCELAQPVITNVDFNTGQSGAGGSGGTGGANGLKEDAFNCQ